MELRGERECRNCGSQWSYYETGEITCPECGSMKSRALDEPTEHTASTEPFDLTPVRNMLDDEPLRSVADEAATVARSYTSSAGFVDAGELQPLEETYLAAAELRRVGRTLGRILDVTEDEELYFLTLLRGADSGERPTPADVPETFYPERGLAIAASVEVYVADLKRVHTDRDSDIDAVLSGVRTHRKRIEALDGDLPPEECERLVRTLRDLYSALEEDDEAALARALERIEQS